jgi:hypothetical protein
MKTVLLAGAISLLLAGCAATQLNSAEAVYAGTEITRDTYKGTTWIVSPGSSSVVQSKNGTGYVFEDVYLRVLASAKPEPLYQLYMDATCREWKFFDRLYDSRGNRLDFVSIDRRVDSSGASVREIFAANLTRQYLDTARFSGLNVKAVGSRGEHVFTLPPHYVVGFLNRVDSFLGKTRDGLDTTLSLTPTLQDATVGDTLP